jgi:hypothetical protein
MAAAGGINEWNSMMFQVEAPHPGDRPGFPTRIGAPSDSSKYEEVLAISAGHLSPTDYSASERLSAWASALSQGMATVQLRVGTNSQGNAILKSIQIGGLETGDWRRCQPY